MKYPLTIAFALVMAAPAVGLASEKPRMMTQSQFDRLDANSDGKVSEAEYRAFMEEAFGTFDANGDGVLAREEVRDVFDDDQYTELHDATSGKADRRSFLDRVMADFHRHDYDNDGYLVP